ncbi:uncharacterized protein LOC119448241 [Dermacentor silvarum]|uniref:uncharacterized protein LOC119448241 n=1 Tax=Dermacentor silvarum TaxID=543639 RepID=UPI0018988181|nr:uncharacterized protein LOC119448241 [Dermacentor silvarum]
MPGRCDVAGCPNGPRRLNKGTKSSDSNVNYHTVPPDEPRRSRWFSSVPMLQREVKEPMRRHVCSLHFRPEDYEHNYLLRQSVEVPFHVRLRRNAVPSIFLSSFEELHNTSFHLKPIEISSKTFTWEAPLLQDECVVALSPGAKNAETQTDFLQRPAERIGYGYRSVGNAKGVQAKPLLGPSVGIQVNTTIKLMRSTALQVNTLKTIKPISDCAVLMSARQPVMHRRSRPIKELSLRFPHLVHLQYCENLTGMTQRTSRNFTCTPDVTFDE